MEDGHRGDERALWLSVKPWWAEKIVSGRKTVELRRRPPRHVVPRSLIYAAAPVSAIVGTCRIVEVGRLKLDDLEATAIVEGCIDRTSFAAYFRGLDTGGFIRLSDVRPVDPHVSLLTVRQLIPGWRVPQSFRYLREREAFLLLGAAGVSTNPAPG